MKFVNLMPHAIALRREDGSTVVLDGTRDPARIITRPGERAFDADGVAIHNPPQFDGISNLPAEQPGVLLLVSQLTALAVAALQPWRHDVVYPATGVTEGAARDSHGCVLAVTRLISAN